MVRLHAVAALRGVEVARVQRVLDDGHDRRPHLPQQQRVPVEPGARVPLVLLDVLGAVLEAPVPARRRRRRTRRRKKKEEEMEKKKKVDESAAIAKQLELEN